jgi:hypothetical protein
MKLLIRLNLLFLALFLAAAVQAQTDYRPGIVITLNNDTLHGFIDYRGDARNSRVCNFRENTGSEAKSYLPTEIKGYRYNESKYYVSKKIVYNGQESTLFLEFLVNGKADLFYFKEDDNSNHFFIEKANGQIFELTNVEETIKQGGRTFSHERKEYIGLLKYAFADCPQLFSSINQTTLEAKPLIKLTKRYHDYVCDSARCIIYEKQMTGFKFKFAPFISMNASFLNFSNVRYAYQDLSYQTSVYPGIGLLMKTTMPWTNEKITFQASAEAGKSYYYGSGYYDGKTYFEEVHFHPVFTKGKAGFKYTFPTGKLRPTVLAGGQMMALFNSSGRRIQEVIYGSQVFSSEYKDNLMSLLHFGYNLELGADYYISPSIVTFINIGYSKSAGANKNYEVDRYRGNPQYALTTLIKTFSINAGIYF